jgi:ABC-2 type transport system ATP-binding protein
MPPKQKFGLEALGLSKHFGPRQAVRSLSCVFEGGRLHGLIGPDGAGKTTLMRLMMGLLTPSQGALAPWPKGQGLSLEALRASTAYMPQSQSLYPDLSVGEHLDFFRDLYQLPRQAYLDRRAQLLAMTRLAAFIDRPAAKLSGGMYKKLGLMCALLSDPELLLLDEPTNGVDPISRREFWDLLYEQIHQGVTVIVSTAYMDEAERCAKVHLLMDGRLLDSGEPRALLNKSQGAGLESLFQTEQE